MVDSDYITLWGIFLTIITFVLRYLIIFKSENNFDVFGHLYFVRQIKKKGRGPFTSIETSILESVEIEHPFLWHWFVGRLPIELIIKYNRMLNPLLDSVYVLIIYFLTLKMGFSLEVASWVILLYWRHMSVSATVPKDPAINPMITGKTTQHRHPAASRVRSLSIVTPKVSDVPGSRRRLAVLFSSVIRCRQGPRQASPRPRNILAVHAVRQSADASILSCVDLNSYTSTKIP